MQPAPVGVEVLRGEVVESVHRVHAVVVDGAGNVVRSVGDPDLVTFLRSAAKPFQALPLVTSGAAEAFGLSDAELALCCGSHLGEPRHAALAEAMLAKAGLAPELLQCGIDTPRTKAARGQPNTFLHHRCSGKHAGMLLLQKHLGADPAAYWRPDAACHALILDALARISGAPEIRLAMDGCSVPTFAMPLRHAARLFARLAMPQGVDAPTAAGLARIRDAMRRHPELVSGAGGLDADVMGASEERLVTKMGAEASEGVGDLASGLGLYLKVEDGSTRALGPALVEALRQLAWLEGRAFEVLGDRWMPSVRNAAGREVGRLKPVLPLVRE